jgi:hypothetical protein
LFVLFDSNGCPWIRLKVEVKKGVCLFVCLFVVVVVAVVIISLMITIRYILDGISMVLLFDSVSIVWMLHSIESYCSIV